MTVGVVRHGARLDGRNRDLAAGEEARLLAGLGDEIGLRQALHQSLVLEGRNQRVDLDPVRIDDLRQQRPERERARRAPANTPLVKAFAAPDTMLPPTVPVPVVGVVAPNVFVVVVVPRTWPFGPVVVVTLPVGTPTAAAAAAPAWFWAVAPGVPNPVNPTPYLFPPNQLTPRSRPALRSTSRKRTFSITCCDGATFIASMTGARREPFGHVDRPRRRNGVARLAAQHDLAVRAGDVDASAAGARQDPAVQSVGVERNFEVDHRDQALVRVEHRNIRRADLLALDIDGVVGHRQQVGDIRRADHGGGEGTVELERLRLVERHRDVTHRGAFDDLRGSLADRAGKSAGRRRHDGRGDDAAGLRRTPARAHRQSRISVVPHSRTLQARPPNHCARTPQPEFSFFSRKRAVNQVAFAPHLR